VHYSFSEVYLKYRLLPATDTATSTLYDYFQLPTMDLNDCLNVLESQPSFEGLYTQICLCYSVPTTFSYSEMVKTLTTGLERLSRSFPWVAGQVINEKLDEGNSGVFKIIPLEKIPRLILKDLRNNPSMPTMDILKRSRFASSMLDENVIAPCNTLPGTSAESPSDFPVFCLQATFITGGLLLTFVSNHNSNDMVGQGLIMSLLSKACRDEQFTSEELSTGNLTRRHLIPLLDPSYTPGPELAYQLSKPPPETFSKDTNAEPSPALSPDREFTWAYFIFPPASLAAIKLLATKSDTVSSGFVSTDDCLTAYIYQSITRARLPRMNPTTEVTFTRAIDCRRYLDISSTYLGLAQNLTYHTYTTQKLVDSPLGSIASDLRTAVDPATSTLRHDTCALATFLNNAPDKNVVNFTATLDLSKDIMLSSWAKVNCYELDFNLGLGKPEAVRRPQICVPVESLVYLMPKTLDGEIAVLLCLGNDDLERLRADKEFVYYGEYIA